MSDKSEDSMSASELKSRLYQTFKQRGWDDALKAQLRKKLVAELQQSALKQDFKPVKEPSEAAVPLTLRAVNSLVADHLRRCQYEYSLSVFLPESETSRDKMFSVQDLLELLHVQPHSTLFQKLAKEIPYYEAKGFLWQLLIELVSIYGRTTADKVVQVDELPAYQNSIEKKLSEVDNHYESLDGERRLRGEQALQERMMVLQREMEAKIRAEMNTELSRYKATELKKIELDLREKNRREVADARREMETTLQARLTAAEAREKAAEERSRHQHQVLERETYNQRQSLLLQLRELQQRETDLKREAEVNARAAKLEEDKRKAIEDNLKFREASVANIEQNYERKFREEVKSFQLDQEVKWKERLHDLERKEKLLREERLRLAEEKTSVQARDDQLKETQKENAELQEQLHECRAKVMSETHRNQTLSEKLRSVVDYPVLREDNAVLRRELENTKMRLAEAASEEKAEKRRNEGLIKQLTEKMSRPSPEVITLRGELERARDQLYQERALCKQKEEHWKLKVQEETQHTQDLRQQLYEQTRQMQEMVKELGSLRTMLRETQRALHNEVYRRSGTPHRQDGDHRQSFLAGHLSTHLAGGPAIDQQPPRIPSEDALITQSLHESFGPIRAQPLSDSEGSLSSVGSTNFMEETRARMRQLEMEAETLNRNYQEFQQRLAEPAAGTSPYRGASQPGRRDTTEYPRRRTDLGATTSDLEKRMKRFQLQDQDFDGSSQFMSLEEHAISTRSSRKQLFQENPEKDTKGQDKTLGIIGEQRSMAADGDEFEESNTGFPQNEESTHQHQSRGGILGQERVGRGAWEGQSPHLQQRVHTAGLSRADVAGQMTGDRSPVGNGHMVLPDGHTGGLIDSGGVGPLSRNARHGDLGHVNGLGWGRDDGREHGVYQGGVTGDSHRRGCDGFHDGTTMAGGGRNGGQHGQDRGTTEDARMLREVRERDILGEGRSDAKMAEGRRSGVQGDQGGTPQENTGVLRETDRGANFGERGRELFQAGGRGENLEDQRRRQQEEEEQRVWEEERRKREDDRRRREEEAREKERQTLLELQRQAPSDEQQPEPVREEKREDGGGMQEEDRRAPPGETAEEKLDPLMAKYMEMAKQRRENEDSEQKEEEPELSTGEISEGSISGDDSALSPIAKEESKSEDPFEDW